MSSRLAMFMNIQNKVCHFVMMSQHAQIIPAATIAPVMMGTLAMDLNAWTRMNAQATRK